MLAASGPGGFAADFAGDCMTHDIAPFVGECFEWVSWLLFDGLLGCCLIDCRVFDLGNDGLQLATLRFVEVKAANQAIK
jgi:hypothetical protein